MSKIRKDFSEEVSELFFAEERHVGSIRNITFQVTDACNLKCSYCYQINKSHNYMTKEIGEKIVDLLFKMYEEDNTPLINKSTKGIILDFIGGEPLLNIDVIDHICTYFMNKCLELEHPWLQFWRASMISNGELYFEPEVQAFLRKFNGFVSFSITLDGPQEVHDACRRNPAGEGNFEKAYAALTHFYTHYYNDKSTKVTLAPENLHLLNTIAKFFISMGAEVIHANPAFEPEWNEEHGKMYYQQLKQLADYMLDSEKEIEISLFDERIFCPLPDEDQRTFCGGNGEMLAFNPMGIAYPCLRYMESSLGNEVSPIIIGDYTGIYQTQESKDKLAEMQAITRRSENTDECYFCPIAAGCAECSAWNYQSAKCLNVRNTNICIMHKARSLANVYYWNKYYRKKDIAQRMKMFLPKEEALKIIDKYEYNLLDALQRP